MKPHVSFSALSIERLSSCMMVNVVSDMYHSLCISFLLQAMQKETTIAFAHIDLSEHYAEIEHKLSITFLGNMQYYWLGSLDNISAKQRTCLIEFLKNYAGPHTVWYHTKSEMLLTENARVIVLPQVVDYDQFVEIANCFFPNIVRTKYNLLRPFFNERKTVPLDTACLLMQYILILGAQQIQQFVEEWLTVIIVPEHSLFSLSTLFFAKESTHFLSLWESLKKAYSVHFWISYWSEQVFRAHQYLVARRNSSINDAKKYAYRLPFSFIQRDWKKHNAEMLCLLHQGLYDLDFRLKQGCDERFLDLWIYQSLMS